MKINLNIAELEQKEFDIRWGFIGGDKVVLVCPHGFPKWTEDLLIFRSSVWTEKGELVSPGFKKFFNWTEAPHIVPEPTSLKDAKILQKIDGSLLICSKYKKQLILRTRGTLDATAMANGFEIEILKKKYPKAFDNQFINSERITLLYEWVSNENKIVIAYDDCPDIKLVGAIQHSDYSYFTQGELDIFAESIGVNRPKVYSFCTVEEMLKTIGEIEGEEGVCVYFNNEQDIKKVKGAWYLALHAFKSEVSIEKVLDMYLEWGQGSYNDFMGKVTSTFDFECAKMALPYISKVCEAKKQVEAIVNGMREFVEKVKRDYSTRKEQAGQVFQAYGKTNRSGFVFTLLDGKELKKDDFKKLYWQVLKN